MVETGAIYEQRWKNSKTFEVRKVLDASTRFVIFLENMYCVEGYQIPEIPNYKVSLIRQYRTSGGMHFSSDRELDDDWVLRSVTKNTFNRWILPGRTTKIKA